MKLAITTLLISVLGLSTIAQNTINQKTKMSKKTTYIKKSSEVIGKTTAFTEIIINASPEEVRARFVEFEKWGEWNTVFPKISVKKGNLNDLTTKPTLNLVINFGRKNDPAPAPTNPKVYENSPEVFYWGFNWGILKAEHVHIFESVDGGKKTRFINYEKMSGPMKGLVMKQEMRENMVAKYNTMNTAFKKYCEVSERN
jgi:hypothetical protein